jgi:hypothetical protein
MREFYYNEEKKEFVEGEAASLNTVAFTSDQHFIVEIDGTIEVIDALNRLVQDLTNVRRGAMSMVDICLDKEATDDEKHMAVVTLIEAIYPEYFDKDAKLRR